MKKDNTLLTKFVITENTVSRLAYSMVKNSAGSNGICSTCDSFDKNSYLHDNNPKIKSTVQRFVYLKNKSQSEILKIIEFLGNELVFPEALKDVVEEMFLD